MKTIAFTKEKEQYKNLSFDDFGNIDLVKTDLSPKAVQENNADCLLLTGKSTKAFVKSKFFRHASSFLVPLETSSILPFLFYGARYLLKGSLKFTALAKGTFSNKKSQNFLCLQSNFKKSYASERCYFPEEWNNQQFLQWLDDQNITYIVLRWYDAVISGNVNDIDILMADEDAKKIRKKLNTQVGTHPVDIFDLGGSDLDQIACFPPKIAQELLQNRIQASPEAPGYIPAPLDHFKSLAYHALIRKGYKSGLQPDADSTEVAHGKIHEKLTELKGALGLTCDLDMQGLFSFLKDENYLPPLDMLTKLKQKNRWLQDHAFLFEKPRAHLKGHYFTLILREIVEEWGNLGQLEQDIQNAGFEILSSKTIAPEERVDISHSLRGGNWSAGPWPVSGGIPYHVILAFDPNPLPLKGKMKKTHPMVSSARILFKQKWRDAINDQQGKENAANFVHTSDNNAETLDYLEHISPEVIELIHKKEKSLP